MTDRERWEEIRANLASSRSFDGQYLERNHGRLCAALIKTQAWLDDSCKRLAAQERDLAEARRRVEELEEHNGKLRSFAREVIGVDGEWWPNLDGGDIQDWAEEHGLVCGEPWDPDGKHADEPIDNHYDLEPGDMVYFESDVLIGPKRSREELRSSDD